MASSPPVGNGAGVTLRTTMAILQQLQGIFSAQVVLKLGCSSESLVEL